MTKRLSLLLRDDIVPTVLALVGSHAISLELTNHSPLSHITPADGDPASGTTLVSEAYHKRRAKPHVRKGTNGRPGAETLLLTHFVGREDVPYADMDTVLRTASYAPSTTSAVISRLKRGGYITHTTGDRYKFPTAIPRRYKLLEPTNA